MMHITKRRGRAREERAAPRLCMLLFVFLVGGSVARAGEPVFDGKGVSYWISALNGDNAEEKVRASSVLRRMGGSVVPYLVASIKNDSSRRRVLTIYVLGGIRPANATALPLLVELMDDAVPEVRVAAASSVLGIDCSYLDRALSVMIQGLREDRLTASQAATAIGSLRQKGAPATEALIALVEGPNEDLANDAARALWKIGPGARAAIPVLEKAVQKGGPLGLTAATALKAIRSGSGDSQTPCDGQESDAGDIAPWSAG